MKTQRRMAVALITAVLVVAGCGSDKTADDEVRLTGSDRTAVEPGIAVNEVSEGKKMPDVELVDRKGKKISTASLLGDTPVIFNYWYSTCRPCKRELPDFAKVDEEMAGKVRFVGVNGFDTPEENESFARDLGVKYDLLLDNDKGDYSKSLKIALAPHTIFVKADGTIVKQVGEVNADELRTIINEQLLAP